jgi:alkylation response protein AidB-like acyl-CoA dehydrogenase
MVSFDLTEEQELVRQMARDFAERELRPKAQQRDRDAIFPQVEIKKLAELGLMGVNVPTELGGAEAGVVAYSLAVSELARVCPSTTVTLAVTNMVAEVICKYGSEEQRQTHVPRITSGEYTAGAFALSEPQCGSDAAGLKTTARRTDKGWVINGTKQWITSGDHAGVTVVWARTGDAGARGISTFLVEQGTPGLEVGKHEDKMGLRGSSTVPLIFEDCEVPDSALMGEPGHGFPVAMTALDGGRIGIASQSVGIAGAALDEATAYARERKSFGKPIAALQAIQWMIADSYTEFEAARLLTLRAALLKEQKRPFTQEASMAKVFASEAANKICYRGLQIHGGYGYVKEYPIERMTRDARVTTIYEGTSEIQRLVIGRTLTRG